MCTETLSLLTAHIHIAYTDPSSCAFGTRMQAPFMRVSEAIFCANDRTKNDKRQGCEFGAYSENGLQTTSEPQSFESSPESRSIRRPRRR